MFIKYGKIFYTVVLLLSFDWIRDFIWWFIRDVLGNPPHRVRATHSQMYHNAIVLMITVIIPMFLLTMA